MSARPPDDTSHTFFDALIDPSLHTNVAPAQWETPPLRPEHGVFHAEAARQLTARAAATRHRPVRPMPAATGKVCQAAGIATIQRHHLAPMLATPAPTLFTFGYEGLPIEAFIQRLRDARVELIVDVRELPLSRKKGFSKTALREHLAAAGIGYTHIPAQGCR